MNTVYKNLDGETRTRDYVEDMNGDGDLRRKEVFAACAQAIALEDIAKSLAAMVAKPAQVTDSKPVTDAQISRLIDTFDEVRGTVDTSMADMYAAIRAWLAENVRPAPVAGDRVNPTDKQVNDMIRKLTRQMNNNPDDIDMARWVYRAWAEDVQKVKQ
jgi:hypothetical protein